jgi:predicted Ser/Thr protein kinase
MFFMDLPLKEKVKYPCQVNTRTSRETVEKLFKLKQLGIDVGELQRQAINSAIDKALKTLDKRAG